VNGLQDLGWHGGLVYVRHGMLYSKGNPLTCEATAYVATYWQPAEPCSEDATDVVDGDALCAWHAGQAIGPDPDDERDRRLDDLWERRQDDDWS